MKENVKDYMKIFHLFYNLLEDLLKLIGLFSIELNLCSGNLRSFNVLLNLYLIF